MTRLLPLLAALSIVSCATAPAPAPSPEPRVMLDRAPARCHATGSPERPDPACTPGAVETQDLAVICGQSTRERRDVTTATKRQVFAQYGVPWEDRAKYECDHLVPLCAGGSNDVANLWPQPLDEAHVKDRLEEQAKRRICDRETTAAAAQRTFESDWTAAER